MEQLQNAGDTKNQPRSTAVTARDALNLLNQNNSSSESKEMQGSLKWRG